MEEACELSGRTRVFSSSVLRMGDFERVHGRTGSWRRRRRRRKRNIGGPWTMPIAHAKEEIDDADLMVELSWTFGALGRGFLSANPCR